MTTVTVTPAIEHEHDDEEVQQQQQFHDYDSDDDHGAAAVASHPASTSQLSSSSAAVSSSSLDVLSESAPSSASATTSALSESESSSSASASSSSSTYDRANRSRSRSRSRSRIRSRSPSPIRGHDRYRNGSSSPMSRQRVSSPPHQQPPMSEEVEEHHEQREFKSRVVVRKHKSRARSEAPRHRSVLRDDVRTPRSRVVVAPSDDVETIIRGIRTLRMNDTRIPDEVFTLLGNERQKCSSSHCRVLCFMCLERPLSQCRACMQMCDVHKEFVESGFNSTEAKALLRTVLKEYQRTQPTRSPYPRGKSVYTSRNKSRHRSDSFPVHHDTSI